MKKLDFLTEILRKEELKKNNKIKNFTIKIYNDLDHDDLTNLYKTIFPNLKSEKLIVWKNKKNPFGTGDPFVFLMKDKDRIIAQYSVTPLHFYINGKKVLGVQSGGTMTLKKYWGLGISTFLAKFTYEYSKMEGYQFVYGFPNPNSIYLIEKKLGWTIFGNCDLFIKEISSKIKCKLVSGNFEIKEIQKFDKSINVFWNQVKKHISFVIKKDMNYLNWRFVDHPWAKFKKFLIYDKSSNIVSYFVLKKYKDIQNRIIGHIVDFLIDPRYKDLEKKIFKLIEAQSINEFKGDCSSISFWLPNSLKETALNELGYCIKKMETYVGYKVFNYRPELVVLSDLNNWYFTMALSDVF